jgi:hypothetical protein
VSNEDFLKDNTTVSNLKVHTSYGLTGNSEIDPYKSLAIVDAGTILLNNSRAPYSFVNSISNPNLKWEKTAQVDAGVELGISKSFKF